MIKKFISEKQFEKLLAKRNLVVNKNKLSKFKHGDFLVMIRNEETKKATAYFMKRYFMQVIELPYSAHLKIRKGSELLISNLELPKFSMDGIIKKSKS